MKANKFFLGLALVGAILTGCEKDPEQTGNYDTTSYMSVSIAQAGGTRATDGDFLQGTPDENKITTVDFYFYDAAGAAFSFTAANDGATDPEGGNKYASNVYTYTPGTITDKTDNIDELVEATLVIQHNKGNIPATMIAVINSETPGEYKNKSLSEVKNAEIEANKYVNAKGHVMTNSVYKGVDGEIVMETPITYENLAINAADALANPVTIYVERTAARVQVKEKAATEKYDTDTKIFYAGESTEISVYAKIMGWDIVTYANTTTLAKSIEKWADDKFVGFNWNQAALHRSYWAKTNTDLTKTFTWTSLKSNQVNIGVDYCLENTTPLTDVNNEFLVNADGTRSEDLDITRTNVTKVVVAAQLVNADGTPLTIYNWFGSNYRSEADLKTAVAQSLKNDLILNGTPITAAQIKLVENVGENLKSVKVDEREIGEQYSYEVYFDLADGVATTGWKNLGGTEVTASDKLKEVRNVKVWNNGMAYYIVNIEHLGTKTDDYREGYYGIVRNHAYEITFSGIKGLGTPVYSATTEYPEPVTPDFTESYVAAEINILSWHLVQQDVILGQ